MKKSDKVTIVYYGDVNSVKYPTKVVTIATLEKYHKTNREKLKGGAFILVGIHNNVTSFNLPYEKYYLPSFLNSYKDIKYDK